MRRRRRRPRPSRPALTSGEHRKWGLAPHLGVPVVQEVGYQHGRTVFDIWRRTGVLEKMLQDRQGTSKMKACDVSALLAPSAAAVPTPAAVQGSLQHLRAPSSAQAAAPGPRARSPTSACGGRGWGSAQDAAHPPCPAPTPGPGSPQRVGSRGWGPGRASRGCSQRAWGVVSWPRCPRCLDPAGPHLPQRLLHGPRRDCVTHRACQGGRGGR